MQELRSDDVATNVAACGDKLELREVCFDGVETKVAARGDNFDMCWLCSDGAAKKQAACGDKLRFAAISCLDVLTVAIEMVMW